MRMLEFGAIDLDAGARVAEHCFRHGLDDSRFARAGRSQKQEVPYRTSGRVQARQEHLIDFHDLFNRLILTDDLTTKGVLKFSSVVGATRWVEHSGEIRSHMGSWPPPFLGLFPHPGERAKNLRTGQIDKFCHSPALRLLQAARHPTPAAQFLLSMQLDAARSGLATDATLGGGHLKRNSLRMPRGIWASLRESLYLVGIGPT